MKRTQQTNSRNKNQNNKIVLVDSRVFLHVTYTIENLKLNSNTLAYVGPNEFRNMTSIQNLDMRSNQLVYIDSTIIQGLLKLRKFLLLGPIL